MTLAALPLPPTPLPEPLTPDDVYNMGQQGLFELVDGEVMEKPMGNVSGKTTALVSAVRKS